MSKQEPVTPITVFVHPQLGPAVSGRELNGLIAKSNASRDTFSDWFADRIKALSLENGTDYLRSAVSLAGHHRPMTEYLVSAPAAIRISEYQLAKRGLPVMRFLQTYQQNPEAVEPAQVLKSEIGTSIIPAAADSETGISGGPAPADRSHGNGAADALPQPEGYRFEIPAEAARPKTAAEQLLEQATLLVEAEKKRAAEPQTVPVDNEAVLQRLNSVEGKLNAIVGIIQQTATSLAGLLPVEAPAADPQAPPTTRVLLTRLVNSFAAADRKSEHEVWRYLYGQFDLRSGVNAYAQAAGKTGGQSYLAVIESGGKIEDLYTLAKKLFVLPALK